MARVWDCRNLSHLSSRRRDRRHAELAAVHHRRPGLLDLGGDGDAGRDIAASARRRRRRGRTIGRAGADRDGTWRRAHRPPAVRAWSHPRRPRHSVRAVSGDRGISGRDRLGDGQRRGAGDHRRTADHRRSPRAHQLLQPCQTAGGRRGRLCALHRHAATEQKPRSASRIGGVHRCREPRSCCGRHVACAGPGQRLAVRAASRGRAGPAVAARPPRAFSVAFAARSLRRTAGRDVRHRDQHAAQHRRNRARDAARGRPRTRSQLARDRQPGFGGAGRLCELRFAVPHHDQLCGRRARAAVRSHRCGDFGGRPVRQSRALWGTCRSSCWAACCSISAST